MRKQFILVLLSLLLSIGAWAESVVTIGTAETHATAGSKNFSEPVVSVKDGGKDVTSNYTFTYSFANDEGTIVGVESVDERGVKIVTDPTTGSTIEKYFGQLMIGRSGTIKVAAIATPKTNEGNILYGYYIVNIDATETPVVFYPSFTSTTAVGKYGKITMKAAIKADEWNNTQFYVYDTSTRLPKYKVTTLIGATTTDITSYYDVTIAYSGSDKITYDPDKGTIRYPKSGPYSSLEAANNYFTEQGTISGTITYTFTPKEAYRNLYSEIVKVIDVFVEKSEDAKENLHLDISRQLITEDNVTTDAEGLHTVHVYKYGKGYNGDSMNHYQYRTPNPALVTNGGVQLPIYGGDGTWGDFYLIYKIVEDGTYYDNCMYTPYYNKESEVSQPAGETGKVVTTINSTYFQVTQPGLVKVACYAALPKGADYYGINNRNKYNPYQIDGETVILKDENNVEYEAYSAPIYFYIDVMKRVPKLSISPNPSTLVFEKGFKINMKTRFEVSGYIDDSSNGVEGHLIWGAGTSSEVIDGKEVDHFSYSFFISDRTSQYIHVNNWPCTYQTKDKDNNVVADWDTWREKGGDENSYICYEEVKANNKYIGQPVQVGDIIKVGDNYILLTDSEISLAASTLQDLIVEGQHIEVTESHIDNYSSRKLQAGDFQRGITYNSKKGWGEKYELWDIEFVEEGNYDITYTIHPYNHVRWDVGSSNTTTYTFSIKNSIPTVINLSYGFQVTDKDAQWNYTEPDAKVLAPSKSNLNVTDQFNLSYCIDESNSTEGKSIVTETLTENQIGTSPAGTYSVLSTSESFNADNIIAMINTTTGEVYIGDAAATDVKIKVSGTKKNPDDPKYGNPDPAYYIIRIIEGERATWEVISSCKTDACSSKMQDGDTFKFSSINEANGRFQFLTSGVLYGGTVITGVPGIIMTVGAKDDDTWTVVQNTEIKTKCCNHESANGYSAVAVNNASLVFDDNDELPVSGGFLTFTPSCNGFLTIDANQEHGTSFILKYKDNISGKVYEEIKTISSDKKEDLRFDTPLLDGQTYYLFNITNPMLRLHGFAFEPAFIFDSNTTYAETITNALSATTYLNGLSTGVPTLANNANASISYVTSDKEYCGINDAAKVDAKKMTLNASGEIFDIDVTATVKSTDASLGDCVDKHPTYKLRIIDIPTYRINESEDGSEYQFAEAREVTTTNISTDIIMTFGNWTDENGKYADDTKQDAWSYKSSAGAASRIGSNLAYNDPTYNATIDGFDYYIAQNQNPVDENNTGALVSAVDKDGNAVPLNNGSNYQFASGVEFEKSKEIYYNTTYRLPCRGAYLKFEPRESGIVLLYLVQNGSVDYHYGIEQNEIITFDNKNKQKNTYNQVKWRPLYITDEIGRPADMVTNTEFGDVSKYLPSGEVVANPGSFTLGISRCNPIESEVDAASKDVTITKIDGCSFDWSQFRGTETDKSALLQAWANQGQRESIIQLENGGFVLPHKAYVRYAFNVKAGKTYFVFQHGSKFEFGGFSFVPKGYPNNCKYAINSTPENIVTNATNQETNTTNFTWQGLNDSYSKYVQTTTNYENLNVDIHDCRNSDIGTTADVTRSFIADKWTSLCLPFSVSMQECKRVFGEGYVLVTLDGVNENDELVFIRHANSYIEAGRPYFVKPTQAGVFQFNNVSIEATATVNATNDPLIKPDRFSVKIDGEDYTFKGIYKRETISKGSFFVLHDYPAYNSNPDDGLFTFNADTKIGGYRAYLSKNATASTSAKAFAYTVNDLLDGNDEKGTTTGILYIADTDNIEEFPRNAAVYDINGTKVANDASYLNDAPKGIYIVNGKKITIK